MENITKPITHEFNTTFLEHINDYVRYMGNGTEVDINTTTLSLAHLIIDAVDVQPLILPTVYGSILMKYINTAGRKLIIEITNDYKITLSVYNCTIDSYDNIIRMPAFIHTMIDIINKFNANAPVKIYISQSVLYSAPKYKEIRRKAIDYIDQKFSSYVIVDRLASSIKEEDSKPNSNIAYLADRLELIDQADIVYFCEGCEHSPTCKLERMICEEYKKPILI